MSVKGTVCILCIRLIVTCLLCLVLSDQALLFFITKQLLSD